MLIYLCDDSERRKAVIRQKKTGKARRSVFSASRMRSDNAPAEAGRFQNHHINI